MRPISHAEYLGLSRFAALDGMRAIAAVMVVMIHFAGHKWAWVTGWLGVSMFFVISGFLITTLALREERKYGKASVRDFYIRRVFRILPAYYVILGAIVVLSKLRGDYVALGFPVQMPYLLTFNQELVPGNWLFGQAWTLGIEQKFYLVWPLVMFLPAAFRPGVLSVRTRALMTLGLIGVGLLLIPYATPFIMILIGCLLAFLLDLPGGFRVLGKFTHPLVAIPIAALVFWIQTHLSVFGDIFVGPLGPLYGNLIGPTCYSISCALLVVSTLGRGPVSWLFSTPPMRFMGDRSYSLYLLQSVGALVLGAAIPMFTTPRLLTAFAVVAVTLLLADLVYRWVELPMIGLGRRLIKHLKARAAKPEPAPAEPVLASPLVPAEQAALV